MHAYVRTYSNSILANKTIQKQNFNKLQFIFIIKMYFEIYFFIKKANLKSSVFVLATMKLNYRKHWIEQLTWRMHIGNRWTSCIALCSVSKVACQPDKSLTLLCSRQRYRQTCLLGIIKSLLFDIYICICVAAAAFVVGCTSKCVREAISIISYFFAFKFL